MRVAKTSSQRRFTDEDVGEIIALASRLDDPGPLADPSLTVGDVVRIASELGISESAVLRAVGRHAAGRHLGRLGRTGRALWRALFYVHLFAYASTVLLVGALDLLTGNGFDYTQYVVFVWGLFVMWHGATLWWTRRGRQIPS